MLRIIYAWKDLDFQQWMEVYEQSNQTWAKELYDNFPQYEQQLRTQEDVRCNIQFFLRDSDAFCAVWEQNGKYLSALRMEPFEDGLLLEGLETKPSERQKGYGKILVQELLLALGKKGSVTIYSHIHKRNLPSRKIHEACGFQKIQDHAVFIDGSVSHNAITMQYKK